MEGQESCGDEFCWVLCYWCAMLKCNLRWKWPPGDTLIEGYRHKTVMNHMGRMYGDIQHQWRCLALQKVAKMNHSQALDEIDSGCVQWVIWVGGACRGWPHSPSGWSLFFNLMPILGRKMAPKLKKGQKGPKTGHGFFLDWPKTPVFGKRRQDWNSIYETATQ